MHRYQIFTTDADTDTILPKNTDTEFNTDTTGKQYILLIKCRYNTDAVHSTKTLQKAIRYIKFVKRECRYNTDAVCSTKNLMKS